MQNDTLNYTTEGPHEPKEWIQMMEFICEVALMLIIGLLGILGNLITITMFSRLGKKQLKFHRLMILLASFDTAYILLNILLFVVPGMSEHYRGQGYAFLFAPILMPLTQISLTGSVYCTIAISVERYLVVCHPFYTASKNWSAKRYIIPILLFSVIYNLPRFFELSTTYNEVQPQNTTEILPFDEKNQSLQLDASMPDVEYDPLQEPTFSYGISLTPLRQNKYYYTCILIFNLIFMAVCPFILLFLLTSITLRRLMVYSRQDNVISSHNRLLSINVDRNSTLTPNNDTMVTHDGVLQLPSHNESNLNLSTTHCPSSTSSPHHFTTVSSSLLQRPSVQTPFSVTKRLKTNEIVLSKVSLIISLVFIICHSIRFVPNIYELILRMKANDDQYVHWPDWVDCFTYFSHLLTVFNASVNFYIYYFVRYEIKSVNCITRYFSTRNRNSENVSRIV